MNREQHIATEHSGLSTTDCKNALRRGRGDLPRRKFLALVGGALSLPALLRAAGKGAPPKPQNVLSPDEAVNRLVIGNYRYVDGNMRHHECNAERAALVLGQNPFAGVLSCADSRVGPEYVFDTGRGDISVCRVAGNLANADTIASFEYAVGTLSTPPICVLGHQGCGGIDATIKQIKDGTTCPGHIPSLTEALTPAIESATDRPGDLLTNATKENVLLTVQKLQTTEPILSEAVTQKKLKIAGGSYNLHTGKVERVST